MATKTEAATLARQEKKAQAAILAELAKLGGKMHDDEDVTYSGTKLILPESMSLARAIQFLEQKREEMDTPTSFSKTFNYRPWDGAWCMWNALKRQFGVVGHRSSTVQTLFGPQKAPPRMIAINVDVNEQDQVPWGNFNLPGFKDTVFTTHMQDNPEYGRLFQLLVEGPKRYGAEIQGIFKLIELELQTNSLYRGKAFDGQDMPEFIDLSGIDPDNVVYSQETLHDLEGNVWAQLRHTEEFHKLGIPLKRAVLVHGPYGTGKTLAAILTGQEAVANGWTFIKGRPGRDNLSVVMQTARLYQPAVVFYEDVDQIADVSTNSESALSRLLDDFDGIEAKNTRILCVLTTNHADRIHPGMARPGRLDAMIKLDELDLEGMAKLVKKTTAGLIEDDIDWEAVFEVARGYKPAFVTEFASRAVRYALVRKGGDARGITLVTDDIINAAKGLRPQYELMTNAKDRHEPPALDVALRTVLEPELRRAVRENVHEEYLAYEEDE